MPLPDDFVPMPAAQMAALIRRRVLSPVELVRAVLDRIAARNPSLNAFVHLDPEGALAAARAAERQVMAGVALGPLHGVPIAIKDLFDFKPGWPATFGGIRALAEFRPPIHCAFAERMERAGAIILGKTNSPTMGFRGTCDNFLFGPTRNPFDLSRNSGGSSGGSAAAVADGLVPLAEGTDGGGSIRIPASWCGVFGYKAAFGRNPFFIRPNAFGHAAPFIVEGPLTRTVEDAALAMDALHGYDSRDPFCVDDRQDFLGATRRSVRGMRIGWSSDLDVFPVDPRVSAVVERAVKLFEQAGAVVEPVKLGITRSQQELSDLWCRLFTPVNRRFMEGMKAAGFDLMGAHRDDFPPEYLRWMDAGAAMSAEDFFRDQEMRAEIYDAVCGVFERYDLLVSPTLACLPVENLSNGNTVGPTEINGVEVNPLIGWCMTYFFNFSGHPAASVPAGLAEGRWPVGMQIVGRRWADTDVFAASATFERLQPWAESYRICAARGLG
jgi:amidase/aspartyl-tRNA(Asn)/glutamyl-tRNA(Gln) amidotransferase subunit A